MAKQNRTKLKGYFETGDIPNQNQYADLIDSNLNLSESNTGDITLTGKIDLTGNLTASSNISASGNITADTLISNNIIFTSGSTSIKIEAPDEPSGNITGADLIFEAGNAFGANFKGGNITLQAGKGSGAGDGGDITINAGGGISSGSVNINGNISSSGVVSVGNGSATDPSITFGSDTNTGIYKHSDDQLGLVAGGKTNIQLGTNAVKLKHDDNIKLETTSLGVNITGNISASGTIVANKIESDQLFSRVGDANTGIQLSSDTVVIEGNNVEIAKFNTSRIELNHNITASGNISASGNVLANNATIVEQLDMTSASDSIFNMYQESSLNTSFHSRGSLNSFIEAGNSTANLGVGTSTPAEKLTVHGNISGSGNLKVDGSQVDFTNLPTSDPSVAGRLYRDGTDLKISLG